MTLKTAVIFSLLLVMTSLDALRDCSNTSMDENSQQQLRKRPASPLLNNSQTKKSRHNDHPNIDNYADETTSQNEPSSDHTITESSVERLLSVPLSVIFRHVSAAQTSSKPLLTRAEAHCLLQIAQLAHQVDIIVELSSQVLEKQIKCQYMSNNIQSVALLRSVLPLLAVHGRQQASHALQQFQSQLDGILQELQACAGLLGQYSEQNWILSDSLMDANATDVATSKRMLAELQEEVCTRIQGVWKLTTTANQVEQDIFQEHDGHFVSMKTFCNRLFGMEESAQEQQSAVAAQASTVRPEEQLDVSVSTINDKKDAAARPAREVEQQSSNEHERNDSNARNALLALAKQAEHQRGQWSQSTVSIQAPSEHHSPSIMNDDDDESEEDDEMEHFGEMTQRTSSAVAALTVLAAGGGSRNVNHGDD